MVKLKLGVKLIMETEKIKIKTNKTFFCQPIFKNLQISQIYLVYN